MKIKKENLSNLAFIVLLGLLLFTPVGFHARVLVSRIFSFSPAILDKEDQSTLTDYSWNLSDQDKQTFNFDEFEGRVVLVNIWATWCPPCVAEMPSLQDLYSDYGERVAFVMLAHDEREKVAIFLNKKEYSFPVYFENSPSPERLAVESIPTTFVIDKKGKIIIEKTGAANWNSKTTRELFDKLLAE